MKRFKVEYSESWRSLTVVAGSSCLPAKINLEPTGRVAEADRNSRRFATVWVGLTLRFMPGACVSDDVGHDCGWLTLAATCVDRNVYLIG